MSVALRPYPEYQPSDHPWLGTIPTHWEVRRNGRLFSQRNETGFADLPILEVSLRTGVRVRTFGGSQRKQVMFDRDKYKRAVRGDIAYNMMRLWQGAVGLAPVDGLVSPAYVVARPFAETDSRYYAYLFRTSAYMNEVNQYSRGIVKDRNRLYWDEFKQMPSSYPPPDEQGHIADFLDAHGRLVVRYIRNKQRLIALLNEQKQAVIDRAVTRGVDAGACLTPSGIEWLGDVPAHWVVKPLKRWARVNQQTLPETTDPDYVFRYLDIGAVETGQLVRSPERLRFGDAPSRARRMLSKGDTIVSTVRTYLKAIYFLAEDATDLIASTGFAVLTPTAEVLPEYLGYVLQSGGFIERVIAYSVGVAYPAIAESRLASLHLAFPPTLVEQCGIVEQVKSSTQSLEAAIQRTRDEMALLREYRTRLIADVVTGKLDVRHVVPESPAPVDGQAWLDDVEAALADDEAEEVEHPDGAEDVDDGDE
ncbi:MAG: restriction endonuclease subunit S [Chloroflexi bacterium]|nr:restriction endonuclease subunit S [Chloroflexota bacterium]